MPEHEAQANVDRQMYQSILTLDGQHRRGAETNYRPRRSPSPPPRRRRSPSPPRRRGRERHWAEEIVDMMDGLGWDGEDREYREREGQRRGEYQPSYGTSRYERELCRARDRFGDRYETRPRSGRSREQFGDDRRRY